MEFEWRSRGKVTVTVDGRIADIPGELLLMHDPDFVIYAEYFTTWRDGTLLTVEEKEHLLEEVVAEAESRGWKFEIQY